MDQPDIVPGVRPLHPMVQVVNRVAGEAREDEESQVEEEGGQGSVRTAVWRVRHVNTGLRDRDPNTSVSLLSHLNTPSAKHLTQETALFVN